MKGKYNKKVKIKLDLFQLHSHKSVCPLPHLIIYDKKVGAGWET